MKQKNAKTLVEKIYEREVKKRLTITNTVLNRNGYYKNNILGLQLKIFKSNPIIRIIENNKSTVIFVGELTKYKNGFNKDFIEP